MRRLLVTSAALALLATPVLAQQNDSLSRTMQSITGALSGQSQQQDREMDQYRGDVRQSPEYRRLYNDTQNDLKRDSNQQLINQDRRLRDAWVRMEAASDAVQDEMRRRNLNPTQTYSGSSGRDSDRNYDRNEREYQQRR